MYNRNRGGAGTFYPAYAGNLEIFNFPAYMRRKTVCI